MTPANAASPPSFITPLTIEFPMDGRDVKVTAANVAQLAALLAVAAPVIHELAALPPDLLDRLVSDEGPTEADIVELLRMLSELDAFDVAAKVVELGAGFSEADARNLLPDRFAYLFAVVLQVNADFFARALPVLREAAQKLGALLPTGEKQTSSNSTPGLSASAS